mgnify:CR=1 FL=1
MRKFIRKLLRAKAEKMGVKPSRYVRKEFDRIQVEKYGDIRRKINRAKGTHVKNTFRNRIADALQ